MSYGMLADLVVLIHFLWILFLILGAFWGTKNGTVKILHICGLAFALILQLSDWYCPLTHLELWLRSKQHPSLIYKGSFIIHYIEKVVYVELSHTMVILLTILLCGFNVWLYFVRKARHR